MSYILKLYSENLDLRPLSPVTRRIYMCAARDFLAYMPAKEITPEDAMLYIDSLGVSVSTQAVKLSALADFFRLLKVPFQPKRPRVEMGLRPVLSLHQKGVLMKVALHGSARDRLIIDLTLFSALRTGEICNMNEGQIFNHPITGLKLVLHDREVWLNFLFEVPRQEDGVLVKSRLGDVISPRALNVSVRKLGEKAGFKLNVSNLRDTCIQNWIDDGAELDKVARMSGTRKHLLQQCYRRPNEGLRGLPEWPNKGTSEALPCDVDDEQRASADNGDGA